MKSVVISSSLCQLLQKGIWPSFILVAALMVQKGFINSSMMCFNLRKNYPNFPVFDGLIFSPSTNTVLKAQKIQNLSLSSESSALMVYYNKKNIHVISSGLFFHSLQKVPNYYSQQTMMAYKNDLILIPSRQYFDKLQRNCLLFLIAYGFSFCEKDLVFIPRWFYFNGQQKEMKVILNILCNDSLQKDLIVISRRFNF